MRDPSRHVDLLVSGDDEPRPSPFTRRRLSVAGGVLLGVALVVGAVELRERRAAAAEERRLDRVLDLSVEPRGASAEYDATSRSADLELSLLLRNGGPRDVVVERGRAGEYVLVQELVQVPAGGGAPLLLQRSVACSPTTPPAAAPVEVLRLELRTQAGPRQLELPLDPLLVGDQAARACGFLPVEEAVDVQLLGVSRLGTALELSLDLGNRSVDQVSLASVDAGPGLRALVAVTERGPAALPLALPPGRRDGTGRGTSLELQVTVVDCAQARGAPPQVELLLRDEAGRVSQPLVAYEPAFLASLVSDTCPS